MTTPSYFATPEKLALLQRQAAALIGTPFFANSEAPGRDGGIDCVHTLNWLYRTTGAIGPVAIPRQTVDHGQHSTRSLLIAAFETWPELRARFACVWTAPAEPAARPAPAALQALLRPGDALCFRAGYVAHHGGVLLPAGDVLHTLKREGVHTVRLDAVIHKRCVLDLLSAVYRPLPR